MSAEKLTGDQLLERINPRKRVKSTSICLDVDLIDEWEDAQVALQEARAGDMQAGRLAGGRSSAATLAKAQAVLDIEQRIEDAQMKFTFQALEPHEFAKLKATYPPRKGDQFDMLAGYNRDAVADDLVVKCKIEPEFSPEGWIRFVSVCPPGEWAELRSTAQGVNDRLASVPKSDLAASILAAKKSSASSSRRRSE